VVINPAELKASGVSERSCSHKPSIMVAIGAHGVNVVIENLETGRLKVAASTSPMAIPNYFLRLT